MSLIPTIKSWLLSKTYNLIKIKQLLKSGCESLTLTETIIAVLENFACLHCFANMQDTGQDLY